MKIKEPGLTFSQFGNFENTSEQKQDASGFGLSQFESVPLEDPKIQARKSAISFSKNIESSVDVFAKFANPSANKDPSVETSFNQDKNAKFIESKDLTLNSKAAPIVSNKAVEYFFPEASK